MELQNSQNECELTPFSRPSFYDIDLKANDSISHPDIFHDYSLNQLIKSKSSPIRLGSMKNLPLSNSRVFSSSNIHSKDPLRESTKVFTPSVFSLSNFNNSANDFMYNETYNLSAELHALIEASKRGDSEVVSDLLKVNIRSHQLINSSHGREGNTPLHTASMWGRFQVVFVLLSFGADLNARNSDKETPLISAAKEGHVEIVKLLLENGSDVNQIDKRYNSALFYSVPHPSVVQVLLNFNASLGVVNEKGRNALHEASQRGCATSCAFILEKLKGNESLSKKKMDGRSRTNSEDSGVHLIHGSSDEDSPNTPRNSEDRNKAMEKKESNREYEEVTGWKDMEGNTPLHLAAYWGHDSVVDVLVNFGVPLSTKNEEGKTPLDVAKNRVPAKRLVGVIEKGAREDLSKMLSQLDILRGDDQELKNFTQSADLSLLQDMVLMSPNSSHSIYRSLVESPVKKPLVEENRRTFSPRPIERVGFSSPPPLEIACPTCLKIGCLEHMKSNGRRRANSDVKHKHSHGLASIFKSKKWNDSFSDYSSDSSSSGGSSSSPFNSPRFAKKIVDGSKQRRNTFGNGFLAAFSGN